MIKIRLYGTKEECLKMAELIRKRPDLHVLSTSVPYPDRGESEYVRVYCDVELKENG